MKNFQEKEKRSLTKSLWKTFTKESYNLDFEAGMDSLRIPKYKSKFRYNILEASKRQQEFFYQVYKFFIKIDQILIF